MTKQNCPSSLLHQFKLYKEQKEFYYNKLNVRVVYFMSTPSNPIAKAQEPTTETSTSKLSVSKSSITQLCITILLKHYAKQHLSAYKCSINSLSAGTSTSISMIFHSAKNPGSNLYKFLYQPTWIAPPPSFQNSY